MRGSWMAVGAVLVAAACSSQKPVAKVDDSGLARLNDTQMEPVDEARIEEGRAKDDLARARANEADARARLEVAKSDRAVADAELKRALAERDLLKKQYADETQMADVEQEIAASQGRIRASDLKLQYLQQMIGVAEAERGAAEAHVTTTEALTEQAKYRAMKAGNVPQAGSVKAADVDRRVAAAQSRESKALNEVAKRRNAAADLYSRWQQADARTRTLARPTPMPVPPPKDAGPTSR